MSAADRVICQLNEDNQRLTVALQEANLKHAEAEAEVRMLRQQLDRFLVKER